MNLNQLRYVIKVAETGSINRAASNLFISQSVLSTSIRNLENELGHEIFIRSSKGIEITPYGRIFLSYIPPLEQQLQLLDGFLYRERTPSNQTLSVVSSGFPFVTHICANLYQKYVEDGLHIKQQENFGSEAMSMVSNQLADVGVVRLWDCYQSVYKRQFESMKLEFHPIVALNIAITVGPNNPLFEHDQEYVAPDMLSDYPMVLYDYMDTGPFSDINRRLNLKSSSSRISTSSRAAIYEAIAYTDAYYLNSDYSVCPYFEMDGNMRYLPQRTLRLKDCGIKSVIGWIKRTDQPLAPVAQEMVGMFYEYLAVDDSPEILAEDW